MQQQDGTTSFERDIRPLFRDVDIDHMAPMGILLDDYTWMSNPENARQVYDSLAADADFRMPPDGPFWSDAQLETLSAWMKSGYKP